ncbi:MAG: hypothetical protein AAF823_04985 [Planctomycetota bacterium]
MAVLAGATTHADDEVVYRETFPVADGEAAKLTDMGWEAWLYDIDSLKLHQGAAGYTDLVRGKASQPADAEPINADTPEDAPIATGMLINWNRGTIWPNPTLYFTQEPIINDASHITSVSWFQNNQGSTGGFRLAVKVGGDWWVTRDNHIGFQTVTLALAEQGWHRLDPRNLEVEDEASHDELPGGPIDAIEVFGHHTGYAELDSFTIRVDSTLER